MSRLLVFITLFFSIANAHANFELAMEHYTSGEYDKAFQEFDYLAKIGITDAQFNLGIMHYKGEGIDQNVPLGYAWMALSVTSGNSDKGELVEKIYTRLPDQLKNQAHEDKDKLTSLYSNEALALALAPEYTKEGANLDNNVKPIRKVAPVYPKRMSRKGRIGWADVIYTVAKDGTTRNQQILFASDPEFKKSSIQAVKTWLYIPAKFKGKPIEVYGVTARLTYDFDPPVLNKKKVLDYIDRSKQKAMNGTSLDNYKLATFISGISSFPAANLNAEKANHWYFEAAKDGFGPAEFQLGKNILTGNYCETDTPKSISWLYRSANHGFSDAQYFLAIEMISGARLKKNISGAISWLENASDLGNQLAKLKLAWILSTSNSEKLIDPSKANQLFQEVPDDYTDQLTYFEVAAAVYAVNNNFKMAVKFQKRALKEAKKNMLPTTTFQEKLALYKTEKSWTEDL